jgi:hypothetical protein
MKERIARARHAFTTHPEFLIEMMRAAHALAPFTKDECLKEDCTSQAHLRGLCGHHYRRALHAGTLDLEGLPSKKAPK